MRIGEIFLGSTGPKLVRPESVGEFWTLKVRLQLDNRVASAYYLLRPHFNLIAEFVASSLLHPWKDIGTRGTKARNID